MYYIAHIIKFILIVKIINKKLLLWFYNFDIAIICIMSFNLFSNLIFICIICIIKGDFSFSDTILYILREINGFDICDFELPLEFDKLND